ncbi:MAG: large subunit ribosomal protein L9 [Akkermansiaceae bacterium]|jgi:large subunit ribosomal protein L9
MKPKFTLDVGKNGKAFGSVTSIDIHKALEDKGVSIDRTAIQLNKPIKSTGQTDVEVKLHADVTTSVTVTVEATAAQ